MHSQVFADAGDSTIATKGEKVSLPETSNVLEVMLQYMYLQPQPDLSIFPFEVMAAVAEAVEKYSIYAAMGVCRQRMRYGALISLSVLLCNMIEQGMYIGSPSRSPSFCCSPPISRYHERVC